uniref:numb-like protein n=1 Tax=Myxine glutinosa TaxID=7769 RepID=UPI00358EF8EB
MNKLRRSLRKKKETYLPDVSRSRQWEDDEESVRKGHCKFPVKYLGCVAVEEPRGMHVCEDAFKRLRFLDRKKVRAVLWVSADGLRVVDDAAKDLIIDQTIENVSCCASGPSNDKAFSYICRDGTTRRWMCHSFLAVRDSGKRLSHAVGCAFAAFVEHKQRRQKECGVSVTFDANRKSLTREGSARTAGVTTEQAEPVTRLAAHMRKGSPDTVAMTTGSPAFTEVSTSIAAGTGVGVARQVRSSEVEWAVAAGSNRLLAQAGFPHAIPRKHAPLEQLVRQDSFRGFPALSEKTSPFKQQLSLRLNDLPSTAQRRTDFQVTGTGHSMCGEGTGVAPMRCPTQQVGHQRTLSEAERWLEKVIRSVRIQEQQHPGMPYNTAVAASKTALATTPSPHIAKTTPLSQRSIATGKTDTADKWSVDPAEEAFEAKWAAAASVPTRVFAVSRKPLFKECKKV